MGGVVITSEARNLLLFEVETRKSKTKPDDMSGSFLC